VFLRSLQPCIPFPLYQSLAQDSSSVPSRQQRVGVPEVWSLDSRGFAVELLHVSRSLAVVVTDDSEEGYGWLMFLKLGFWVVPYASLRRGSATISSRKVVDEYLPLQKLNGVRWLHSNVRFSVSFICIRTCNGLLWFVLC